MSEDVVRTFVERVALGLRNHERAERADALLGELGAPRRQKPALFVVGEDKRGKSSLINALLGRLDLAPVGVEVVTGAPITFFAASPPTAMVFRYGEAQPATVPYEEARSLATVAGNPGNVENVRAVAVGLEHGLLHELNLIDTPGVGGLESGHGALTLQSLRSADALIFAVEAGAQFRASELEFLERAAARVDTVILVLTKVDLHRGWRAILEDNTRILEARSPRLAGCPTVAVSSLLALRALRSDDSEDAAELRHESGIGRLESMIAEQVVVRSETLRQRNLLRVALAEVAGLERTLRERLAALGSSVASHAALEVEQQRLSELREGSADWAQRLDIEVRRLSLERTESATRGTLMIKRRYDERLRHVRKQEFDTLPGELIADLTALAGALNEEAVERLFALVQEVLTDVDKASPLRESLSTLKSDSLQDDLEGFALGQHELAISDKLSVLSSFASGRSLGALGGAMIGTLLAPPVGIAVGFGVGGLFAFHAFKSRTEQTFTTAFQRWMAAQIQHTQVAINTTFARRMLDLQAELRTAIQEAIGRREAEITESLEAARALFHADEGKRVAAEKAVRQRLEVMEVLRNRGEALLASMDPPTADTFRGAPPHSSPHRTGAGG